MKYEIFPPLSIHEVGKRPNQEDNIFPSVGSATQDDRLFILCDGMGGHNNGEVASNAVCSTLSEYIRTKTDKEKPFTDLMLTQAMAAVYNKLNALDKEEQSSDRKMGTTMVLLYFHAGGLMAAHIGDSRYYHIRPRNHEIIYHSKDHSLINDLYDVGELSLQEMKTTKIKNVIQRVVMPNQESPAMPDIVHIKDIRPGDWFYMCSDGMLENMDDEELLNILCNDTMTDEQKRDCLIAATDNNKDNHSAHLIHIGSVVHEIIDENEPDDEQEAIKNNKLFLSKQADKSEVVVATYPQVDLSVEAGNEVTVVSDNEPPQQVSKPASLSESIRRRDQSGPSKSQNKGVIYMVVMLLIVIVLFVVAYFVFFNKEKQPVKQTDTPSTGVVYEEVPSGSGEFTRDRQEQEVSKPASGQSARQPRNNPSTSGNGTNSKPTGGTPVNGIVPVAGGKNGAQEPNGMKEGMRAIKPGTTPPPPSTGKEKTQQDQQEINVNDLPKKPVGEDKGNKEGKSN